MKIIGTKKLIRQMNKLPDAVRADVVKMVKKSGNEFVTVARALVPVATGELKSTIKVTYSDKGLTAVVSSGGSTQDGIIKAIVVEGGRRDGSMTGAFYMRRTKQYLGKKIRGRLKRAVKNAVKRVANG